MKREVPRTTPVPPLGAAAAPDTAERLAALLAICQRMNAERDLPALLDLLAREAARVLRAERATIFLLDRERQELVSHVALGSPDLLRLDARLGVAGACAMTGETLVVPDTSRDTRFYSGIDTKTGFRTRSLIATPLRAQTGEILGVFEALNKRRGTFGTDEASFLQALATHAALALENAQLIARLKDDRDALADTNARLLRATDSDSATRAILGTSPHLRSIIQLVMQISDSTVSVLITGESGTGKELFARAIHQSSPRAKAPWVALNCAALPESLVESEMFGIERGVATGVEPRVGRFEQADGGTLFLDEIGDLSLPAQAKLLRTLQEQAFERVGGRRPIPIDVRVIAATSRDLEAEIARERFRADLYYRLNVVHIHTPALREMRADVPLLAAQLLDRACHEIKRAPKRLSPRALRDLCAYPWPGNVRELRNEMLRLAASCPRATITEDDLSESIRRHVTEQGAPDMEVGVPLKTAVARAEKQLIVRSLALANGNQVRAAKLLGLSRQGLLNKIKRYGIRPE